MTIRYIEKGIGLHDAIADAGHSLVQVDGEWIASDEDAVQAIIDAYEPPAPDPKLIGVEFEGVMCSATGADQAGLAAVLLVIQIQGAAFRPTRFWFENGSTLVIHLGNYQAFMSTWMPFRQSFFAV